MVGVRVGSSLAFLRGEEVRASSGKLLGCDRVDEVRMERVERRRGVTDCGLVFSMEASSCLRGVFEVIKITREFAEDRVDWRGVDDMIRRKVKWLYESADGGEIESPKASEYPRSFEESG